ncbi:MAG: hypothetical protein K2N03_01620 [Muribaculaceae bacterium]|nr:hypothetical protein [Muribaculaceae bacterium]
MKRSLFLMAAAAMFVASCSSISNTATTGAVDTKITNRSTANLVVSDKVIKYTFTPTSAHQRAGLNSMRAAAVAKALEVNGNGDVLVCPEYEIKQTNGKVKYITVTGHVGTYEKFHSTTQEEADIINTLNGGSNCKNKCKH